MRCYLGKSAIERGGVKTGEAPSGKGLSAHSPLVPTHLNVPHQLKRKCKRVIQRRLFSPALDCSL